MKRRRTRAELLELLGLPEESYSAPRQRRPAQSADEDFAVWSAARAEANLAYDDWCSDPGAERYLVYRAAEDRADAAEIALARGSGLAA